MWRPQSLVRTAGRYIIDHTYAVYFVYQEEMCETQDLFSGAVGLISMHVQ